MNSTEAFDRACAVAAAAVEAADNILRNQSKAAPTEEAVAVLATGIMSYVSRTQETIEGELSDAEQTA